MIRKKDAYDRQTDIQDREIIIMIRYGNLTSITIWEIYDSS